KQKYWQLLPLNPVEQNQTYSPYSSISSMAGNVLLISPEELVRDRLLTTQEIIRFQQKPSEHVDFLHAQNCREDLLRTAYGNSYKNKKISKDFTKFRQKESYWLNDFALYMVLKTHHNDAPWYDWPDPFKERNARALDEFSKANEATIQFIKWQQFIFFKQWQALKSYANDAGVSMFGDLPIYVSHDSADVWSHPEVFNLDKRGKLTGIAGVPPDYFNKNGQLWGMPTFKWDVLKRKNYNWWVQRIRKNLELYDMLRLDHFRAFADYWEVPANQTTAIRGKWKQGPGQNLFNLIREVFPELPFIAEDLGDINDAVYQLRDSYDLPGMKVLQFAFGNTMPVSDYIPHNFTSNFVVYTGTHDNNTTRGWYRKNITSRERAQISKYLGKDINEETVAEELSRLAYASVAETVILPLQDILGLDESARMNTPASTANNWRWRFKSNALKRGAKTKLSAWVDLYNRG
ncbi:MAG TPA: 4-alpha-glucanotransferase, partial [Chryseolinea sp.]|nr:4-alpha-glucanotransferase [Chryseolinea sp.]